MDNITIILVDNYITVILSDTFMPEKQKKLCYQKHFNLFLIKFYSKIIGCPFFILQRLLFSLHKKCKPIFSFHY